MLPPAAAGLTDACDKRQASRVAGVGIGAAQHMAYAQHIIHILHIMHMVIMPWRFITLTPSLQVGAIVSLK